MRLLVFFAVLFNCALASAQQPQNNALDLYHQVLSGAVKLNDLSPQQKKQVITIHGLLSKPSCSSYKGRCAEACDSKTKLESAANDLANCAKRASLSEDCARKFRDTKDAFEKYESMVSEVSDYCG